VKILYEIHCCLKLYGPKYSPLLLDESVKKNINSHSDGLSILLSEEPQAIMEIEIIKSANLARYFEGTK